MSRKPIPVPQTHFGAPSLQPKAAQKQPPRHPVPPTRFGTPGLQTKAAEQQPPQHPAPTTRFGVNRSAVQAMWTKEQDQMSKRKKELVSIVNKMKMNDDDKKSILLDLESMSEKIVNGIDVNPQIDAIRDILFPPEPPMPKGAVKIDGKPAYLLGEIQKTKVYGYLDEKIFNKDNEKYKFYLEQMKCGLISSKSTGESGVKKEPKYWVVKATLKQAKANQGLDNVESPAGDIKKVDDVLLISFTQMVKRH